MFALSDRNAEGPLSSDQEKLYDAQQKMSNAPRAARAARPNDQDALPYDLFVATASADPGGMVVVAIRSGEGACPSHLGDMPRLERNRGDSSSHPNNEVERQSGPWPSRSRVIALLRAPRVGDTERNSNSN